MQRPAVRVNQLGYLPAGPKHAVWVSDALEPIEFRLHDGAGRVVVQGRTVPWPAQPEPTSGLAVHVLDCSTARHRGEGFVVDVGGARSRPFAISEDLYRPLARDALAFFYLQRCGIAIDEARAPGYGRPVGHAGDASVEAWRGPDAARLYPGWSCPGRFDVSGGWYDAGDHGKYVTSGAMAVWQLLVTLELLRRRGPRTRWSARTEALLVEECRWQLDWLLRMQVPRRAPYAGLAFHRVHGTEWAPLPCWPHADPTTRVVHRPSTGAALHLVAAAACGARVLCADDPSYARRLLGAALTAYRAAHREPTLIAPDDRGAYGGGSYGDDDLADDWAWAAAELWLATRDPACGRVADCAVTPEAIALDGFDFDRIAAAAVLDLALHGHEAAGREVADGADRLTGVQAAQPWGQPYAPADGWDWGSNGRLLNNLVVLAIMHELTGSPRYLSAAARGMDYLLGCNALGQSYVTGYGTDASHRQRARHFARALDPTFPPPPPGALAGGPTSKEHPGFPSDPELAGRPPQCRYLDEPSSETTNDVCVRWNAPLVFMAAVLSQ